MKIIPLIYKSLTIYIYGSIHIGLAASFLLIQNYLIQGVDPKTQLNYIFLVFFTTTASYSLHRLSNIKNLSEYSKQNKHFTILQLRPFLLIISSVSFLISFILLFKIDTLIVLILAVGFFITLLYNNPFNIPIKKWRELGNLKILLVAFVWALVTALIPGIVEKAGVMLTSILFIERFIFIFALTIPFDIRDIQTDKMTGFNTLVAKLGPKKSRNIAIIIFAFLLPAMHLFMLQIDIITFNIFIVLLLSNIIIALFIWYSRQAKSDLYYTGILDGMMIIQPVALILASI